MKFAVDRIQEVYRADTTGQLYLREVTEIIEADDCEIVGHDTIVTFTKKPQLGGVLKLVCFYPMRVVVRVRVLEE